MKISASIYSDKNRGLEQTINDLVAHQVDMLHVDCNDDPKVFEDIAQIRKWCSIPIDLHIISETPEVYFDLLRKTPVEYVTFQYEQLPKGFEMPSDISGEKGLAIITPTDVDVFSMFENFDFLLLMATIPGQSGGVFAKENFSKIRQFKKMYPLKKVHVDGGVNGEVSFLLRNMGVRASVSGSFLFKAPSVGQALLDLTKRDIESTFKVVDFMVAREECPILKLSDLDLKAALQSIEDGKFGFTIIEDNNEFKGIISNADIRRALLRNFDKLPIIDAVELLNENPITIDESATVNDMLQLVKQFAFPIMYLPVVDNNGKISGCITFLDLVKGEV